MSKPTVALAMIVAAGNDDEAPMLARALGSVNGYIDEIYIQLNAPKGTPISDKVRKVAERFTDMVYEYEWEGNFVKARNDVFSKVDKKYDWIMWMDSDDTIDNPEEIQPVAAIMPKDVNGLYILYDYDHDEFNNVTVSHWVSRMVRNNDTFAWKSSIDDDKYAVHETLIAKLNTQSVSNNEWKVVHHAERDRREDSLARNIDLLEKMFKHQNENGDVDPRILFYLATHYYDAYRFRETKELLYDYLQLSGWNEERSEAHVYMGKILKMEENTAGSKMAFLAAIGENQQNPTAYIELGRLDYEQGRYAQAVDWLKRAADIKRDITPIVRHDNRYELYMLLAQAEVNLGGSAIDDAMKSVSKALKLRPYDPEPQEAQERIIELRKLRDNIKSASRLIHTLEEDEEGKITLLIDALPKQLADSPPVIEARQKYTPSKKWDKKSIAIYVGQSPLGVWGPWSMDEGGTGGSEEAVIRLSRELATMGWKVTVYGMPGERAGFDFFTDNPSPNVEWKQYWEINTQDEFDVLISWRAPHFFDHEWKARKKYLWLHDVLPEAEITQERIDGFDKAIFVSKYHAARPEFKLIPDEKKFISGNGIDPENFEKYDGKFKRDSKRMIYMSANERGLRVLYDIWPEVKAAVPDAILDIYYGWHSFDAINKDNPERMAWKASMVQKAKELDGVTERGRIGQDELHQEIFKSGIFAYPCTFPEVNCITAQKAMAGGAVPVTSDFAVMKDIIKYGQQVPMPSFSPNDIEFYKDTLIKWLTNPKEQDKVRPAMMKWARKTFDWKVTAKGWDKEMS